MTRAAPYLCIAGLLFAIAGCASVGRGPERPPAPPPVPPPPTARRPILRGLVVHGRDPWTFRPCETRTPLRITDRTGLLWGLAQEMTGGPLPAAELFAVVEGEVTAPPPEGPGAGSAGGLTVTRVHYLSAEGFGCGTVLDRFRFRAYGNEPFWSAEVSARKLSLARLGKPALHWTTLREQPTPNGVRVVGERGRQTPVELTLTREPCRDTMSGAYHEYRARLRLGTEELSGCALPGTEPAAQD